MGRGLELLRGSHLCFSLEVFVEVQAQIDLSWLQKWRALLLIDVTKVLRGLR